MKLKPCPFCGSEGTIISLAIERYVARCSDPVCLVFPRTPLTITEEAAIAIWNRRAEP